MERSYVISFGDSDKYKVNFNGTKEEFENSAEFNDIKDKVYSYLKEKFPTGGYEDVVRYVVAEDDGLDYPTLDKTGLDALLTSVAKQVEVLREGLKLNDNAPFDKH